MFLTNDEFLSDKVMHFRTEFSEDNGRNWKELNQGHPSVVREPAVPR
jgi:hypothetical protein